MHCSSKDFVLRSDDEPRTIMSGQALFNGMYPTAKEAEWNVMDRVRDNLFPNFHVCPKLNEAVKKAKSTKEYREHVKKRMNVKVRAAGNGSQRASSPYPFLPTPRDNNTKIPTLTSLAGEREERA